MACGTRLEAVCPQCGAKAVPGARFCIACGAALEPAREPVTVPAEAPDLPEERRRVTILFADLWRSLERRLDVARCERMLSAGPVPPEPTSPAAATTVGDRP